jgi:sRNA-binding protein
VDVSRIRRSKLALSKKMADFLAEQHPELFGKQPLKPWARDLDKVILDRYRDEFSEMASGLEDWADLAEEQRQRLPKNALQFVFQRTRRTGRYLMAVVKHEWRYDLDGAKAERVDDPSKMKASTILEARRRKREARKNQSGKRKYRYVMPECREGA